MTWYTSCGAVFIDAGYDEIIIPSVADPSLWTDQSGKEIEGQMWTFRDKGDRPCCLIPEATALVRDYYENGWKQSKPKPVRVFYTQRCYRYERPQLGRYREFTQLGVEILGPSDYENEAKQLLRECLDSTGVYYEWDDEVVRGLSYYSRNGFEARSPVLGAQQQIAGGGSYENGCGWAIGMDRLIIAKVNYRTPKGERLPVS